MDHPLSRSWLCAIAGVGAAVLLWARAPFASRNFWGEDGAQLFAQAMEHGWIKPITSSLGGYFLFLPRVLSPVATLGPLEVAPAVMFSMCALVLGWFAVTVVLAGDRHLDQPLSRVALAFVPVVLPIVGFEVIGGLANLHFLMLCPAAVILVGRQESRGRQVNDVALITMAGLTSPLTLGLAPLVALRLWWDWRVYQTRSPAPVVVGWALGITVQLAMIATLAEDRDLSSDRSVAKAGFLFLERVVSFNLLPLWPGISAADETVGISAELVIRALIGLVMLALLATTFVVVAVRNQRRGAKERAELVLVVPVSGIMCFLAASMLTGPEPRYAVFPAFCIVWALLMVMENISDLERLQPAGRVVATAMGLVLLASVVTHWAPSPTRRSGPAWVAGLDMVASECAADPDGRVEVPILPKGWTVPLDCSDVLEG